MSPAGIFQIRLHGMELFFASIGMTSSCIQMIPLATIGKMAFYCVTYPKQKTL